MKYIYNINACNTYQNPTEVNNFLLKVNNFFKLSINIYYIFAYM